VAGLRLADTIVYHLSFSIVASTEAGALHLLGFLSVLFSV